MIESYHEKFVSNQLPVDTITQYIAMNFNSGETCIDVGSSLWQTGGGRCNSDGSRPG